MSARAELRGMSKAELIARVRSLESLLAEQMNAAPGIGDMIRVDPIVRDSDLLPEVHLRSGEVSWSWSTPQARMHALIVLDAAVEAERDAAFVAYLKASGFELEQIANLILEMRAHRSAWLERLTDGSATITASGEQVTPEGSSD